MHFPFQHFHILSSIIWICLFLNSISNFFFFFPLPQQLDFPNSLISYCAENGQMHLKWLEQEPAAFNRRHLYIFTWLCNSLSFILMPPFDIAEIIGFLWSTIIEGVVLETVRLSVLVDLTLSDAKWMLASVAEWRKAERGGTFENMDKVTSFGVS